MSVTINLTPSIKYEAQYGTMSVEVSVLVMDDPKTGEQVVVAGFETSPINDLAVEIVRWHPKTKEARVRMPGGRMQMLLHEETLRDAVASAIRTRFMSRADIEREIQQQ